MLKCEECIHKFVCFILENKGYPQEECRYFKNRSQFVDMPVGKWIPGKDYFDYPVYRCSNCNEQVDFEEGTPKDNDFQFCPFCGAKMVEAEQALKEHKQIIKEKRECRIN